MADNDTKYTLWTRPRELWPPVFENMSKEEQQEALAWLKSDEGRREIEAALEKGRPALEARLAPFNQKLPDGYY